MSSATLDTIAARSRTTLILETTHEAYVATDAGGRITDWNPAAARTFGWSREEAIGQLLAETIIPADDRERHQRGLERYAATGDKRILDRRLELDAVDRSGHRFPVEITISAMQTGGGLSFHAFLHDISERRTSESTQRLAAIVQCSSDAILTTDEKAAITDWNRSANELFGWTREEILGRPVSTLVPSHLQPESVELWKRARRGDPAVAFETERLHKDGTVRQVELTIARIDRGDGPFACSAIYRDITARRRHERELADHCARLKRIAATELLPEPDPDAEAALVAAVAPRARLSASLIALVRDHLSLHIEWVDGPTGVAPVTAVALEVPIRRPDGVLYGTLRASGVQPGRALAPRELRLVQDIADVLAEHTEQTERRADRSRIHTELMVLQALVAALDARDHYTGAHTHAVVDLSRAVATRLDLDVDEVEVVGQVALLHDLGKVGIPDSILQKPGALTEPEWELMREHPAIGARIVASIGPLAHLAPACRAEHERWDGGGYPDGLTGAAIPIASRITLACDAYHAMTSGRPYRLAIGEAAAREQLRLHAGAQFDPRVVDALLGLLAESDRSSLTA